MDNKRGWKRQWPMIPLINSKDFNLLICEFFVIFFIIIIIIFPIDLMVPHAVQKKKIYGRQKENTV